MTGLGLSVCTIFLFAGFAFHTRLRFYWDQYLAEMGQLLTQNLRFGSGPLPAVATAESCTPGCTKTFVKPESSLYLSCVARRNPKRMKKQYLFIECWICRYLRFHDDEDLEEQEAARRFVCWSFCNIRFDWVTQSVEYSTGLLNISSKEGNPIWGFTCKSVSFFMSGLKNHHLFFCLINSAIHCKEIKVKQIGHRILFPTSTALFVEAAKWKINNCHFALWAETISNSVNIRDKKSHQLNYQERVMFIWYLSVIKMMCLLVTSSWQLTNMI